MFWSFSRAALGVAALFSANAALADPDRKIDPAAYVAEPQFEAPALSPDGARIAARTVIAGKARLAVFDASKGVASATPVALPEIERLQWHRWLDSKTLLVSLLTQGAKPTARLATVEVASNALRQFGAPRAAGAEDEILYIDAANTFLLLKVRAGERATPAVYRVDLRTGTSALAVPAQPHVWDWMADSDGVVRAGMAAKGDNAWMLYRKSEGDRFNRAADKGIAEQLAPVRGSDTGYALAEAPSGRVGLFAYDFRRGRLGKLIYEHPSVDVEDFVAAPDGRLLGVHYSGERDEMLWLDPAMVERQEAIDAALPGRVNRVESASADERRLLVLSESSSDRGAYYLFENGHATLVTALSTGFTATPATEMRAVSYKARDGLALQGFLTLPAGRGTANLPMIVLPHGGPFARDEWGYDPWVQYLAAKGYAVFQPNFRGSTGFGRAFMDKGDGEWGRGMQNDMDDGVAWLAAKGTIDPNRVCVMGASYGGYAALWAAARDTGKYRCAISFAGISDIKSQLEFDRPTFTPKEFRAWRQRILGTAPSLESLSPLSFADKVAMPLLIAHGTADDTVPPEQSQMMHDALSRLGKMHEFVTYSGEGHNMEDPANSADFLRRVGAFLDRHNPS